MRMYDYCGLFAGSELAFQFRYPGTARYYKDALTASFPRDDAVRVPEKDITDWTRRWNITDRAYAEYVLSCSYACDRLMQEKKTVFHGASFLWRGRAYLFTAPSGTGKTTQLRLWKALFPEETEILNGDKPVLEITGTGSVTAHPSPWKGKEGYGRDDITAPLGGIILLRQDRENHIERLEAADAAKDLFGRSYSTFNTEEEVRKGAEILEGILKTVPVWRLSNKGDGESARMTYQALMEYETGKESRGSLAAPAEKRAGTRAEVRTAAMEEEHETCGKNEPGTRTEERKNRQEDSPDAERKGSRAGYELSEGVVLFRLCGRDYIFPSRRAGGLISVIISAPPELVSVLYRAGTGPEESHQPGDHPWNGSLENGSLESGSLESGSLENGSLENGSLESGSLEIGSLENGSLEIGSPENGGPESGQPEKLSPETKKKLERLCAAGFLKERRL